MVLELEAQGETVTHLTPEHAFTYRIPYVEGQHIVIGDQVVSGQAVYDIDRHFAGEAGHYHITNNVGQAFSMYHEGGDITIRSELDNTAVMIENICPGVKQGFLAHGVNMNGVVINDDYQGLHVYHDTKQERGLVPDEFITMGEDARQRYKIDHANDPCISCRSDAGTQHVSLENWSNKIEIDGHVLSGVAYRLPEPVTPDLPEYVIQHRYDTADQSFTLGNRFVLKPDTSDAIYQLSITGQDQVTIEPIDANRLADDKVIIDNFPHHLAHEHGCGACTPISFKPQIADSYNSMIPTEQLASIDEVLATKATRVPAPESEQEQAVEQNQQPAWQDAEISAERRQRLEYLAQRTKPMNNNDNDNDVDNDNSNGGNDKGGMGGMGM